MRSRVVIDTCFLPCKTVRKFLFALEAMLQEENFLDRPIVQRVMVAKQDDGHSYRWQVALNALLLLCGLFGVASDDVSIPICVLCSSFFIICANDKLIESLWCAYAL